MMEGQWLGRYSLSTPITVSKARYAQNTASPITRVHKCIVPHFINPIMGLLSTISFAYFGYKINKLP